MRNWNENFDIFQSNIFFLFQDPTSNVEMLLNTILDRLDNLQETVDNLTNADMPVLDRLGDIEGKVCNNFVGLYIIILVWLWHLVCACVIQNLWAIMDWPLYEIRVPDGPEVWMCLCMCVFYSLGSSHFDETW